MLGDVAVAVNPQDIRYSKFIGKKLIHPFRNEFDENYLMPILADEYVNPQLGTGAVKITPGHDQNDFELGLRHNLPILNILSEEGNIQLCSGETTAWNEIANKLNHVPRFQARTDILKYLQSLNLFRGQQRHSMQIPICSRSGDVVEPLLKPQWFLRTSQMAADALNACKNGELKIEPEYYDKVWHNWLKCNQDWCLSRQLWWGHRIPIWRCSSTEGEHDFICAVSEEEAWSIAKKHPLAVKSQESLTLTQEDDVLDTWFSSALLPFANFGWPNNTVAGEKYYPLSLMETGHDILFFWVARMVMLGQGI
jgi:valyl-tRNA synthetase